MPIEHFSGIGEDEAPRGTAEETKPEALLEASETAANGRARNA